MRNKNQNETALIAVVIPCYKVRRFILDVVRQIGPEVSKIYVVDDCCPEGSGDYVAMNCNDDRVRVIRNDVNLGVGGSVIVGYKAAIREKYDIIIKLDGDGQMDPRFIPCFIQPIIEGEADYTKGNRFFDLQKIHIMPRVRLLGNAMLSFMAKLSTGYWDVFDPTNGYTAIHAHVARHLPFEKISRRYFFETDILFRLNTLRAVVVDVPMDAAYGAEVSNMKISEVVGEFFYKHTINLCKRIFYNYYLHDISIASLELPIGLALTFFGVGFGGYHWFKSVQTGVITSPGTVMLAALPIIMGLQFLIAFLSYDIAQIPRKPQHAKLSISNVVMMQDFNNEIE
ncbi:MAG: glycosyltransferase family 2 protein [Candidatus Methylumidiphilus sp.]